MSDPAHSYSDNAQKIAKDDLAPLPWKPNISTIYGEEGKHKTPYMTRVTCRRARFHIFYRGDADPDPHDHPWGFWTFPFVSYVEEVLDHDTGLLRKRVVERFRWHYRPATFAHRVLHSQVLADGHHWQHYTSPALRYKLTRRIYTFVWAEHPSRPWGFWKRAWFSKEWCHIYWKKYIFQGGKNAPCVPPST
jgi:hypothetical protein